MSFKFQNALRRISNKYDLWQICFHSNLAALRLQVSDSSMLPGLHEENTPTSKSHPIVVGGLYNAATI